MPALPQSHRTNDLRGDRVTARAVTAFAWPPLLFLVITFALPMVAVLVCSLLARDFPAGVCLELSLEAWRQATGMHTLRVLGRTLAIAALVTTLTTCVGFLAAYSLWCIPPQSRRLLTAILVFPLVTSLLLRIYGWMNVLPFQCRGTWAAVAGVMAVTYLPFAILPILRSLERIDPTLVQAAADLGATGFQTVVRVIVPLTVPGIVAGSVLVFVPACGDYLIPHFIGNGKISVLGTLVVEEFMERRNWPYASAASIWLLAIVVMGLVAWKAVPDQET